MKSTKLFSLVLLIVALFQFNAQAQESKVKEFETKPYYKIVSGSDAQDAISKADKYEGKANGYMDEGRTYNREIDDLEQLEALSRNVDARIGALKKLSKLKDKRLSKLEKAYKYYTKSNDLRYSTYQNMLPEGRLRSGQEHADIIFTLEKSAHTSRKEAERIKEKIGDLSGEDLRVALSNIYNYEILAINNLIDVMGVCNNDYTFDTIPASEKIIIPKVKDVAGFYFTVDVGLFNKRPELEVFKGMSPILEDSIGFVYQYVAGKFRTVAEAENAKKEIIKLGFDGAYVTAYERGVRLAINNAIQLANANAVLFAPLEPFLIGQKVINNTTQPNVVNVVHTEIPKRTPAQNDSIDFMKAMQASSKLTATEIDFYQSKESVISQRLKIGDEDFKRLYNAAQLESNADMLLAEVEKIYEDIKLYRKAETAERDPKKKEDYRDNRVILEVKQFVLLIKATELHIKVNEERYTIYKKHLVKVGGAVESPEALRGKDFEEAADANYQLAKLRESDAKGLEVQSDKYLKLMEAKDRLLLAIENQEMAFSIYFDLVTDEDIRAISRTDYNPADIYTKNDVTADVDNEEEADTGKKRKYVVFATFSYSKMSPQLKKIAPQEGVVFKIQFGLFKELPEDNFGSLSPITVEKLKGKTYSRFLVGNFRTWEGVKEALPVVKSKGYRTAYIVAYKDGIRIEPIAGRNIARTLESYDKLVNEEILVIKGQSVKVAPTKLGNIVAGDLTKTTGLVYTVQLGVFNRILTAKELSTTENVNFERLENGQIRYTKGIYNNKKSADSERERLVKNGVDGVFVVAYFNGSRANLKEINKASSVRALPVTETVVENTLIFKVQLAAVTSVSPQLDAQSKKLASEFNFSKTVNEKGLTILSVGDYFNYDEANAAKQTLLKSGFKDGFIVAYKKNKQIPISIALRLQKQ